MNRRRLARIALLVSIMTLGSGTGIAWAAFSATTSANMSVSAAPDWVAPTASASVIATIPLHAGRIRQGGSFLVYANASDTGNPASGVASVTANVSSVATGKTAIPLTTTGGPFTVDGVSYAYRSAQVTADTPLAAGTAAYSLTLTDTAGNVGTQTGFSVIVDNTGPSGADVQTTNGNLTVGRLEQNDTITFTYTEIIDPGSIQSGWSGAATPVLVRINNTGANDTLQIWNTADTVQLPLGQVSLGANYVAATRAYLSSTMVQNGTSITFTLGAPTGGSKTVGQPTAMQWTPSSGATDVAGNPASTALVTESGSADVEF